MLTRSYRQHALWSWSCLQVPYYHKCWIIRCQIKGFYCTTNKSIEKLSSMGKIHRHNRKQHTWKNKLDSKVTKPPQPKQSRIKTQKQGNVKKTMEQPE